MPKSQKKKRSGSLLPARVGRAPVESLRPPTASKKVRRSLGVDPGVRSKAALKKRSQYGLRKPQIGGRVCSMVAWAAPEVRASSNSAGGGRGAPAGRRKARIGGSALSVSKPGERS
jgi:hypothetical protein